MKIFCPCCKRSLRINILTTITAVDKWTSKRTKGPTKLTVEQVKLIFEDTRVPKVIADIFKITTAQVSKIKNKRIHSQLTEDLKRG